VTIAETEMIKALPTFLLISLVSISRPTINMKRMSPTFAITLKMFIDVAGKMVSV
jgi:hypothetical protein